MLRVPTSGPAERERQQQIRRLESSLRRFERVPPHRREAECADEGERDCRMLLAELGAKGYERPALPPSAVTLMTLDELLEDLERPR
jgi:hypothetical protein